MYRESGRGRKVGIEREWKREKGDSIGKLKRENERKGSKETFGRCPGTKKERKRKEREGDRRDSEGERKRREK